MEFNEVKKLKEYYTLEEAISYRKRLWSKNVNTLYALSDRLFDDLDTEENVFIINEFFEKNKYNIERIDVLIEFNKYEFEQFIENNILEEYVTDDIKYHVYIIDEDVFYTYDDFYKETTLNINKKEKFLW